MWLFTETGFVSVVQNFEEKGRLVTRARDEKSLEGLSEAAGTPIVSTPGRDYPFRVFIDRETFSAWVTNQIDALDYTNYKSRMWQTRGVQFAESLHEVWAAMHGVTEGKKLS